MEMLIVYGGMSLAGERKKISGLKSYPFILIWIVILHVCVIELDALMRTIGTQKLDLAVPLNEI